MYECYNQYPGIADKFNQLALQNEQLGNQLSFQTKVNADKFNQLSAKTQENTDKLSVQMGEMMTALSSQVAQAQFLSHTMPPSLTSQP